MAYIGKVMEISAHITALTPTGLTEIDVKHEPECGALHGRDCTCDANVCVIVDVKLENGRAIVERCPFCTKRHEHSPEPGYRVPHCGSGARWFDGYILRILQ